MSDREAMKLALEAFRKSGERITLEAITALEKALAAPQPEPVAWLRKDGLRFLGGIEPSDGSELPLYTAPPSAAPEPTHPGYVIGSHWLETAYSRICAGEAEADVLRDIGLVRITDGTVETADIHAIVDRQEALRRDAERYWWLLNWLVKTGLLTWERCRIDTPESFRDWWILRKPKVIDGSSLIGYGETEDAAIDAAMEDKT